MDDLLEHTDNALAADVVEAWWCPVCAGAAHRTRRPGRPKLYCSNACRQRAYRWRRDHHARTVAARHHPAAGAFVAFGRWHALRTKRDFVAHHSDRRRRQPTVCGALAKPARTHLTHRTHYDFITASANACRRCVELVALPIDPRVSVEVHAPALPPWLGSRRDAIAWVERLEPEHPIRRNPKVLAMMLGRSYLASDQR